VKYWRHICDLFVHVLDAKQHFFGWIELDFVIGIVSLEFFEMLWQTKYRLDRIFLQWFLPIDSEFGQE